MPKRIVTSDNSLLNEVKVKGDNFISRRKFLIASLLSSTGLLLKPVPESKSNNSSVIERDEIFSENLSINTLEVINLLSSFPKNENKVLQLKDNENIGMDVLKVIQIHNGLYIGTYHHKIDDRYMGRLAFSTDLKNWNYLNTIDIGATMLSIDQMSDKSFLIGYEKDELIGNRTYSAIKYKYYEDFADLELNRSPLSIDLLRSLSLYNEGCPSILKVIKWNGPLDSILKIGFHYFKEGRVDRNGIGILTNFKDWKAMPNYNVNYYIDPDEEGGLGDRDLFNYKGNEYLIYEQQGRNNDFGSWSSVLQSGNKFIRIRTETPNKSKSIGNTKVSIIKDKFIVTGFIFQQNSGVNENGEFIFWKDIN